MAVPTLIERLTKSVTTLNSPFTLTNLPGFPFTDYQQLLGKYQGFEEWFNGEALNVQQTMGGKAVDLYPLRINPIRSACFKHAYALFGEFTDDTSGPLAQPKVVMDEFTDKKIADTIESAIARVMYDNSMSSLMMENGILSQVYGGCIFKVSWISQDKERPIRIENINPKEFIGIPKGIDYWNLREAWVIRSIDETEAKALGIENAVGTMYYIEHWTETEYSIAINESPILFGQTDKNTDRMKNPFGFVPFVYIPHQRTGSFYGESLVTDAATGITKELNLRIADAGDATNDQTHSALAMRNVRGTPQIVKLSNGMTVINLGSSQSITGNENDADLFSVTRSNITEPVLRLGSELRADLRRELFIPPVAEGEDEGSQRSAATLVLRMWPLTTHVKSERVFWTTGLITLCRMVMKILSARSLFNVKPDMLKERLKIKWAPILPRDRQAFVEEMVSRAGVNLGSPELLLSLIGDSEDIDLVMAQMKAWIIFLENTKAEAQAKAFQQTGGLDGSQSNSRGQEGALSNRGRKISDSNQAAGNQRPKASRTREEQS